MNENQVGENTSTMETQDTELQDNPGIQEDLFAEEDSSESELLRLQIAEMHNRLQEMNTKNNQLMRIAADFENYRRRQEKEKEDLIKFGGERVILNLLDVIDNFDRALQVEIKPEEYKNFVQGIEMIRKQFHDGLNKSGVSSIDAVGQPFDPELHEAITSEASEEYPDQTVMMEFQKGYLLNGKVIRHSMVKVSSGP